MNRRLLLEANKWKKRKSYVSIKICENIIMHIVPDIAIYQVVNYIIVLPNNSIEQYSHHSPFLNAYMHSYLLYRIQCRRSERDAYKVFISSLNLCFISPNRDFYSKDNLDHHQQAGCFCNRWRIFDLNDDRRCIL